MDPAGLDLLMPMHVLIDPQGVIQRAGPTLTKLRPEDSLVGQSFFAVFDLRDDGRKCGEGPLPLGQRLHLTFRHGRSTPLKGTATTLCSDGIILVNLSFGISVVQAVADYRLSAGDFAHTDLAVEMLYLVEAKSAVLEETKQLNARLQGAKVAAEEQAYTDTLTGLRNRRAMDRILDRMIRGQTPFALMHLDLDLFKSVNDTRGHAAGDAVLQQVATVLLDSTRGDDLVARVGGDEFILVFSDMVDEDRLMTLSERLITKLEAPVQFGDQICNISGSIGITTTRYYETVNADQMIQDADAALYASKHRGRGCATLYDPAIHCGGAIGGPDQEAERPL